MLICCPFIANAVEVSGLYQYTVDVDNKSQAERSRGSKNALLGVLKKVSGQTVSQRTSIIRAALRNTANYMLKFQYAEEDNSIRLNVIFQQDKIDELLTQLEIPVWGNRRPLTLIWLAIEEDYQRELVTKDSYPQLKGVIENNADKYGVPIITPLLDLEDRFTVSVSDVWANFPEPVIAASSRYRPEKIITARLFQPSGQAYWQLDWQFTNDDAFQLNSLTGDKQMIVGQMLESIAQVYAEQYAVLSKEYEAKDATLLYLSGITDMTSYINAKRSIASISMVTALDVVELSATQVTIALRLSGSQADFIKALTFDKKFEKKYDPLSFEQSTRLEYTWLGLKP